MAHSVEHKSREDKIKEGELPLRAWLEAANGNPQFVELLDKAKVISDVAEPGHRINLVGPSEPLKSYLQALVYQAEQRPFWVLVPDEARARLARHELEALLGGGVYIFGARELNLLESRTASGDDEKRRARVLSLICRRAYKAVIVPATATLDILPDPEVFASLGFALELGQLIDPQEVVEQLISAGYEASCLAERAGQFARRGDIIDIVTAVISPDIPLRGYRISFFDIEIDNMRLIDIDSQRSISNLDHVEISPVKEFIISQEQRAVMAAQILEESEAAAQEVWRQGGSREDGERLRQLGRREAERLEMGLALPAQDRWLSLIHPEKNTIFSYMPPEERLWLDEIIHIKKRLDAAGAAWHQSFKSYLEKGDVLPLCIDVRLSSADTMRALDKVPRVIAVANLYSAGNGLPGAVRIDITGRIPAPYYRRNEALATDLESWQDENIETVIFAGSPKRAEQLRRRLGDIFLDSVHISAAKMAHGVLWRGGNISILGVEDVFGEAAMRRQPAKYSGGKRYRFFGDLTVNEIVVHEEHGVARYLGLKTMRTSGGEHDYLHLQYADGDIYIPTDNIDRISKYVGADSNEPKLSRMGGVEWQRQKMRARSSIRKMVTDLVALYAQRQQIKGHEFAPDTVWQQDFEDDFIFEETPDQVRVISEIKQDMESPKVMDRLLCGDVGFGKTEVAFRALFKAVMDGKQAALLAPTTVLVQQHFLKLKERLGEVPLRVRMLSRFISPKEQRETLKRLARGEVDVVVGTHRLISRDVRFKNLGLLVIDEEQRFGVDHKEILKSRFPDVDVLSMTATPIPRTLHMSLSGIRDISLLEVGPTARRSVLTYVAEYDEDIVTEAILREVGRGGQCFYLFNNTYRINRKATELGKLLPGVRLGVAHGKMSERQLENIMAAFVAGEYDVLVCTTIIESGLDMPNVNTIVVENADRMGLAQLYQIRGRVGRSERQAYAYITYPANTSLTETAEKRLAAIRDFTDLGSGFKIALRDLEVRGAGNLLGAEQSGNLGAVGYELYCKMMEEAVAELTGGQVPVPAEAAKVDLDVNAYIADVYIADEAQRLDMYRRMAELRTAEDYRDIMDELDDRYGELPRETQHLLDVAYIRAYAERFGISRVSVRRGDIALILSTTRKPDMEAISALMSQPKEAGRLEFNAGAKPHIIYRRAAEDRDVVLQKLRKLFLATEAFLAKNKEARANVEVGDARLHQ